MKQTRVWNWRQIFRMKRTVEQRYATKFSVNLKLLVTERVPMLHKNLRKRFFCQRLKCLDGTKLSKMEKRTLMTNIALDFYQVLENQEIWLKWKCFWFLIVGWIFEWLRRRWDIQNRLCINFLGRTSNAENLWHADSSNWLSSSQNITSQRGNNHYIVSICHCLNSFYFFG